MTAYEVLRKHQKQLDPEGVEVGVSRQALDELLTDYQQLRSLLGRIHKATADYYNKPPEPKTKNVPYTDIINLYHQILPDLPAVVKLTDKRRRAIKSRWEGDLDQLEDWANYFKDASRKPFLFGRNDRGWTADIDFLLREQTIAYMQEGKYG